MKLKNELEMKQIFAHAMALEQSGRQKNLIFCFKDKVYILNSDKTVILYFLASNVEFPKPVAFFANSYDSPDYTLIGSFITFLKGNEEFVRRKLCRVPSQTFKDAEELYQHFYNEDNVYIASISFTKSSLELLDENLSHIEFLSENKQLKIIQRDIYSGVVIELKREKTKELLNVYEDNIEKDFGPLGMRTNDFHSLFYFNNKIKISFLSGDKGYFVIEGDKNAMTGIVAGCLYDELGTIDNLQEEKDGRKKSKDRNSKSRTNSNVEKERPMLLRRKK